MKTSLQTKFNLKRSLLVLAMAIFSVNCFAQTEDFMEIPELVFRNPVLVSGTAGKQGAIYRFNKVAPGIDAQIKLKKFSDPAIIVKSIDNNSTGFDKAFQPEFGIDPVKRNQDWYIDFELTFFTAGTNKKLRIDKFSATSLDVDGDGSNVQEYVIMEKATSVSYSDLSYLKNGGVPSVVPTCGRCGKKSMPIACTKCQGTGIVIAGNKNKKCSKCDGVGMVYSACDHPFDGQDEMVKGPVDNFASIDTIATGVMANYVYNNKDVTNFRIGAQSGNKNGGAGIRMNSIWFKGFNLALEITPLPVKLTSFTAVPAHGNVVLNWSASEVNFSHYAVQRSTDGKNYEDIAIEFANARNYVYNDAGISSATGMVFYRLRMIDKTGEFIFSDIKAVKLVQEKTLSLSAYPNPVIDQVRISLPSAWQGKLVRIQLYSSNGMAVQTIQTDNASPVQIMPMSKLPKGVYMIMAYCNGETAEQRIIKN